MSGFPDPTSATLVVLRAAHPEVSFGTLQPEEFPEGRMPAIPYGQVNADVTALRWPVDATAPVRVVVYGETAATGFRLALRILATLCDYEGGPDVRSFAYRLGPLSTTDPDIGRPISTITVAARLRPITL